VWQGVSVENQKAADVRIPLLLQTPAAVRFISAEPLLGPVNLEELPSASGIGRHLDALSNAGVDKGALIPNKLDWCIIGGESGPGARPMNPDWARSLRDQCQAAKVAFFMKQMGSAYGPKKGHEPPADLDIKQFPEAR
jgi:protein gp37